MITNKGGTGELQDHRHWTLDQLVGHYRPSLERVYKDHVARLVKTYGAAAEQTGFEAIVLDTGIQNYYFADDRGILFAPTPHFAHWVPLATAGHILVVGGGRKPILCVYAPKDYWHEDPSYLVDGVDGKSYRITGAFQDHLDVSSDLYDIRVFGEAKDLVKEVIAAVGTAPAALVGPLRDAFKDLGWADNPRNLLARLDWNRTTKTEYELLCLWIAQGSGVRGHREVFDLFKQGDLHELDLHLRFLKGAGISEDSVPYGSIVALNERGRILHYQYKKTTREPLRTLLIDAGSRFRGYPSDITRTYAGPHASRAFCDIMADMERRQLGFVAQLAIGKSFVDMHQLAHRGLGELLVEHGVIQGITAEGAVASGITRVFFPHGLGHHLGIQVHDVGSKQSDPEGTELKAGEDIPGGRYLRNIRPLAEGHVVTIEPGLYFIPMLIEEAMSGPHRQHLNQSLIKDLMPHGGIRIEDDIYMTAQGPLNLTRKSFACHT